MNVTISEKKIITGISIYLSPHGDVQDFMNLLEMARRQIEPMLAERRETLAPYVRDMTADQLDCMDRMLRGLFLSLEDAGTND